MACRGNDGRVCCPRCAKAVAASNLARHRRAEACQRAGHSGAEAAFQAVRLEYDRMYSQQRRQQLREAAPETTAASVDVLAPMDAALAQEDGGESREDDYLVIIEPNDPCREPPTNAVIPPSYRRAICRDCIGAYIAEWLSTPRRESPRPRCPVGRATPATR